MKHVLIALFIVPLLTVPAFAGSLSAGDKPMIVAEDVGVEVGNVGVEVGNAITITIIMTIAGKIPTARR
jgi:hypothetical protein